MKHFHQKKDKNIPTNTVENFNLKIVGIKHHVTTSITENKITVYCSFTFQQLTFDYQYITIKDEQIGLALPKCSILATITCGSYN